jgi:release factor glutamine methyltransferase
VSRLLGEREFYGRSFVLNRDTLDPRPETETLVTAGLNILRGRSDCPRIADLGTGSGSVIVSLLAELPDTIGVGVDLSVGALEAARANALRHKVANRLALVHGSWFSALSGTFDLILSNPPYVASREIAMLPREVRLHDPRLALDGGWDGLQAYRDIARDARRYLRIGGHLCVEIGRGQEKEVASIMDCARLRPAKRYPAVTADFCGIPRVLTFASD